MADNLFVKGEVASADKFNAFATELEGFKDDAASSAAESENYALNAAEFGDNKYTFTDTTAGVAATANGQYFRVPQGVGNSLSFRYYKNNSGTAIEVSEVPGQGAITNSIREYSTLLLAQNDVSSGNISNGGYCWVRNPNNNVLSDEYLNTAGTLAATGRQQPSQDAVSQITTQVQNNTDNITTLNAAIKFSDIGGLVLALVDQTGFVGWQIDSSGGFGSGTAYVSPDKITITDVQLSKNSDAILRVTDQNGMFWDVIGSDGKANFPAYILPNGTNIASTNDAVLRVVDQNGLFYDLIDKDGKPAWSSNTGGAGQTDEQIYINEQDPQNKSAVFKDMRQVLTKLKFPSDSYNHFIGEGQSLMQADQGWPQYSRAAKYGNLMLGNSVRPAGATENAFTPLGGSTFNPMVAVTQSVDGSTILSNSDMQALDRSAVNEGESPLVGAVNGFRKAFLDARCLSSDASRLFLSSAVGVSGQILANLIDDTKYYNRVTDCITKAKSIADSAGKSYSVTAIIFNQGQFDYNAGTTKSTYKSLLVQLRNKVNATISSITGQADMPAWFFSEPGYTYSPNPATQPLNAVELWVGMAQWEFCQETPNCFMVGPDYHLPSKGGHLTSNGYRWMGCYYAKAMDIVLNKRNPFKPVSPLGFHVIGNKIYCNFYVPQPPLQWLAPFRLGTRTTIGNKGFRVFSNVQLDSAGIGTELTLTAIDIVSDTIVRLTCASTPTGTVRVSYGTYQNSGQGMLIDSDPYIPDEKYEYDSQFTQWPEENIPELIGNPYPMQNWCIAFAQTFTV
ncbi:TPA: hypothetical protein ACTW8Y_000435 [Raoultella ornithinolytica]